MSEPADRNLSSAATERLGLLFDTHVDRLYRLARRLAATADDAGDLVQETFLKAAQSSASLPSTGARDEEAWLVRVLVNIQRDRWRKHAIRTRHVQTADKTNHGLNPEAAYEARLRVWPALDLLPPRRRAVIVMAEIEGLSSPAIASLLGISAVTVRWHLSRGRRELASLLVEHTGDIHEQAERSAAGRRPAPSRTSTR